MYLVIHDGTIFKKFYDEEEAVACAEKMQLRAEKETAEYYDIDPEECPDDVSYLNGYNGGLFFVAYVDEKALIPDNEVIVTTLDGEEEFTLDTNDIV